MFFTVLPPRSRPPNSFRSCAYLITDAWDDWGKYRTQFFLCVSDENGDQHSIGSVKIGQFGLQPSGDLKKGHRAPSLDSNFDALDERYFSIGQDETYYEALNRLDENLRIKILENLKDCAFDITIFQRAEHEDVMLDSLLRSVSRANVLHRFSRLAKGDSKLIEFQFEYTFPLSDLTGTPPTISFHVKPRSEPPTNIHILIGRNGAGKTRCIQSMASAICRNDDSTGKFGSFKRLGLNKDEWSFAGLIVVSFSAFDSFLLPQPSVRGLKANMIGIRHRKDEDTESEANIGKQAKDLRTLTVKTPDELTDDFCNGFSECRSGLKAERWAAAVQTLENDPLFEEANIPELLNSTNWEQDARTLFGSLSSGHAVVLLAITKLVALVDEKTFLLLDEPEGHLHPPLLSTFIRAISDLLVSRNGVAFIATHSPVVLQEVPRSCVWTLQRSGSQCIAERPSIETFGENVGVLTSSIFGLEVTSSGFHKLLRQAVENGNVTYELLLQHFDGQLGAEARAIARSLLDSHDIARGEGQ